MTRARFRAKREHLERVQELAQSRPDCLICATFARQWAATDTPLVARCVALSSIEMSDPNVHGYYRGTSLIRSTHPLRITIGP